MKLSARFVSFPTYFFCSVSGRDMSGNFSPTNLRARGRAHDTTGHHKHRERPDSGRRHADVPRIAHEEVVLLWGVKRAHPHEIFEKGIYAA